MPLSLTRSAPARHVFGESERGFQGDFEGGEIAVVDADQVRAGIDGDVEFAAVVNFDESAEAIARGGLAEVANLARGEDGGDQQDGIGAVCRGLQDLRGVDGEILAQDGEGDGGAGGFEIGQAALEKCLVGEHAESAAAPPDS